MKAMAVIFRWSEGSERRSGWGVWPRLRWFAGRMAGLDGCRGLLGGWTQVRDLQEMPKETFRDWWEKRESRGN